MNINEKKQRELIAHDMARLLTTHSENDGLRWSASKTDLIEIVHILYCTGIMKDATGLPLTFKGLVSQACHLLHTSAPSNPNHLVSRAQLRKGRKVLPLMLRYKDIMGMIERLKA